MFICLKLILTCLDLSENNAKGTLVSKKNYLSTSCLINPKHDDDEKPNTTPTTSTESTWILRVKVKISTKTSNIEYKYVEADSKTGYKPIWEDGTNRTISVKR